MKQTKIEEDGKMCLGKFKIGSNGLVCLGFMAYQPL